MSTKAKILKQRAEHYRKLADTLNDARAKHAAIDLAQELEERAADLSSEEDEH